MLDAGFSFEIGGVVAISEYSSHKLLPLSPRAPHSGALSCFILLFYIRLGAPSVLSENSCANMRACVSSRASSVEVRCLVSASSSSLEFEFGRRKLHRKRTLTSTNQSQSANPHLQNQTNKQTKSSCSCAATAAATQQCHFEPSRSPRN